MDFSRRRRLLRCGRGKRGGGTTTTTTPLPPSPLLAHRHSCRSVRMAAAGLKSESSQSVTSSQGGADPPLSAIILLSFVLALSFLLIILSCALWANWLPLLTGTPRALVRPLPADLSLSHHPPSSPSPQPPSSPSPPSPTLSARAASLPMTLAPSTRPDPSISATSSPPSSSSAASRCRSSWRIRG